MSAFELLSENDKLMLEAYIKEYGPMETDYYFYENRWQGIETVLKEWDREKSKTLLKLFDNNLILSRPYSYLAQENAITLEISKRIIEDPQPRAFLNWFEKAIRQEENDIEIYDFQGNNLIDNSSPRRYYSKWYELRDCMTSMSLASNKYLCNEIIVEFKKSGHKMKMFKGMKPMKIIHTLVKEFNGSEETFDAFRIWHSMQLNQKRMDGELCLSIHPMDYITMSDNANEWKSCMRWTGSYRGDHGDYRQGTVQCLNSPYIIVAYLHNKNHSYEPIDNYSWNSKQWRELFIVQEGVINEIKGYPFQDENLTQATLMWIKELAVKNLGWEYEDEEVNVDKEVAPNLFLTYNPGDAMYKDIGSLPKHSGRINLKKLLSDKYESSSFYNKEKEERKFITIYYGGKPTCMSCGQEIDFSRGSLVFCSCCDQIRLCACCGEPITDNNESYYVEEIDSSICYDCYSEKAYIDSFDDSTHLIDNMDTVYLLLGYDEDGKIITYDNVAYTYDIKNNWGYQDIFNKPPIEKDGEYYVTYDMVNENSEQLFFNAFDIWPHDWNKFYTKVLDTYDDIVYAYDNEEMRELLKRPA